MTTVRWTYKGRPVSTGEKPRCGGPLDHEIYAQVYADRRPGTPDRVGDTIYRQFLWMDTNRLGWFWGTVVAVDVSTMRVTVDRWEH